MDKREDWIELEPLPGKTVPFARPRVFRSANGASIRIKFHLPPPKIGTAEHAEAMLAICKAYGL